ncbi:MAG: transcription-repair coupling factor [Oscillospiraceae bacterium]|nr:transcription-repair coupling factor [Oscillospiraceae bacterium]
MGIFYDAIDRLSFLRELNTAVKSGQLPTSVTGLSSVHKAHAVLSLSQDRPVLVITPDDASAVRMVSDINEMAGREIACQFPARDIILADVDAVSREYEQKRIYALEKLQNGTAKVLVCSAEACLEGTIPPEVLRDMSFTLSPADSVDTGKLSEKLIEMGYTRYPQTEGVGQFSIRGLIVDIFPVGMNMPIRLELWGDEIDTVSTFDIESQRRFDTIKSVTISPAKELLISGENLAFEIKELLEKATGKRSAEIKKHLNQDLDMINSGLMPASLDKYYKQIYGETSTVFDYFEDGVCVICEYSDVLEKAKDVTAQLSEDIKLLYEDGLLFKEMSGFTIEPAVMFQKALKMGCIYLDTFMHGSDVRLKKLISAEAYQSSVWSGDSATLDDEIENYITRGFCMVVLVGSTKAASIVSQDIERSGYKVQRLNDKSVYQEGLVYVGVGCLSGGFEYPTAKFAVITQQKVFTARKRSKKRPDNSERINSISDISKGDLVVHSLHGIGKFEEISNIETNGVTKDYITIKYAGTDVLYVPVTQLDMVSKYVGTGDDENVKLSKLGGTEWAKTRARVKKACKDMADELIKLYAQRQLAKGFAFSEDNVWQTEFEERFEYQETDDQLRSIQEIKSDMQKPVPMDRLLCGDVGFGKTEVALRAAMKCILDGKQCAILVPTTVLAWQHYQTALRRFEHLDVNIELMSRFRSQKEQKVIARKLERGEIDLVIGTHRLVQNDIRFKDLGLLIIDEEQRFGVAHKEHMKELYPSVDILTLSATPIPRTLNMALSGIRDMSVIEEPPADRYPVQTYVIEYQQGVILQAIHKELRRGGQVYYIHNRIETLDACAYRLQQNLPGAKIGVAHGQMDERELLEIWRQLLEREIDILVCTTIIETGVDVPNVNTLIIEDADRFGLSQLYQLRGRVGRSSRRAYAYFTFRRGKVLSEVAAKRLEAIRELTQFGSGFKIALRDLEIRGVGSILSAKQHGHMEAVGYDMYLQLLEEAIAASKGETKPKASEDCLVDVTIDAFIPETYIESLKARLEAYRKIASILTVEDSEDVIDEFIDRYGEPPKSVMGLIDVALVRNGAARLGIKEITQRGNNLIFYVTENASVNSIMNLTKKFAGRILVNGSEGGYIQLTLGKKEQPLQMMKAVVETMQAE